MIRITTVAAIGFIALLLVAGTAIPVSATESCPLDDPRSHRILETETLVKVTVDWLDHSQLQYNLYLEYRESGGGVWKKSKKIIPDEAAVNEITITGLTPGTDYEFRAVLEKPDGTCKTGIKEFTTEGEQPEGSLLGPLLDSLKNLPGNIVDAFFGIFNATAQAVIDMLTHVIVAHPTVHPNEDVTEIHQKTFFASLLISGAAVMVLGILHILGYGNIGQQHAIHHIGKLVLAMALGAVAPALIQYAVDFSYALTVAFKPTNPDLLSTTLLGIELIVIGFLNAFILLAIAVTFVVRDLYFLFFAAAAPFIFLLYATPYFRRFSQVLISTFWGFILLGPMEMIAFSLTLSLLEMNGMEIPHWLLGFGGIVFMFALPFLLVPAAWMMVGSAAGMASTATGKAVSAVNEYRQDNKQGTVHDLDYIEAMEWKHLTRREQRYGTDSMFHDPDYYRDYPQPPKYDNKEEDR